MLFQHFFLKIRKTNSSFNQYISENLQFVHLRTKFIAGE